MDGETLQNGTPDIDTAEVEDGEIVDSDDEAGTIEGTVKKEYPEGPAFADTTIGSKRPFETIWSSHSGGKKGRLPSSDEDGEEGELISDDDVEESEGHSGDDHMDYGRGTTSADYHNRYEGSMYSYSHSPQNSSTHSPSSSKFSGRSSGPGGGRNSSSGRRSTRMSGANRKHISRKEPRSQPRRHTDLPPATDPFWGEFKVLLPTPDIPPVEGRDLELDYPPLSDELAEEYGLNHVQIFTLDTGNHSNSKQGRKGQDKDPHSESGNFTMKMEMQDSSYPERGPDEHREVDPLHNDYPLLGKEEESEQTLKDLVLGAKNDRVEDERTDTSGKKVSLKKKLKSIEWHKRQQEKEKQVKSTRSTQPCRFYVHGNCRAGDECPYSHDVPQEKKKREICKYHLTDSCTKGSECTYYHGPIPCKYHHSPTGCYRGDQCRFSHDQLTEETNEILQQVLKMDKQKKQQQQTAGPPPGHSSGFPPPEHPPRVKQPLLPTPPHLLAELTERGIIPPQPRMTYFSDVVDQQVDPYSTGPSMYSHPPPVDPALSLPSLMSVEPGSIDPRSSRGNPEDQPQEGNFPPSSGGNDVIEQPPPLFQGIPSLMEHQGARLTPPPLVQSTGSDPRKPHERPTSQQTELKEPLYADQSVLPGQPAPNKPRSGASKYPHLRVKKRGSPKDYIPLTMEPELGNPGQNKPQEHPRKHREIFQMPKSLNDPSSLDKPLDPIALFGNSSQDTPTQGGAKSKPHISESTTYGEIVLPGQPTGHNVKDTPANQMSSDSEDLTSKSQSDDATTIPYYAMFDTGLGGDELEIDSAFGTLS